jgi:hypothetical protein
LGDGGAVPTLTVAQESPVGLAADANNLYVWNVGDFMGSALVSEGDGTVIQIALDGGAQLTLGQHIETGYRAPYTNPIAIDSKNVYWIQGASGNDGAVVRAPIGVADGGTPLYTQQAFPEAIATDGNNVYWTDWGTFDAQGNSNNDGAVWQGPVDGGTPVLLASNQLAPVSIAVDSSNVYWTNIGELGAGDLPAPNTGSVMQTPIGGGGKVTTLASAQAIPLGVVVAGGTVYWCEYVLSGPGLIQSVPVGGGTVTPVAAGLADPYGIAVSNDTLYWEDAPPYALNTGAILSLTLE